MRVATSEERAFAWHRESLEAIKNGTKRPPIHESDIHCGWFRRRLISKGPWVPCRIYMVSTTDPMTGELTGPEVFKCEVNGIERDPGYEWTWLAGQPISEDDYMDMLAGGFAAPPDPAPAVAVLLNQGAETGQQNSAPVAESEAPAPGKTVF